MTGVGVGVVGGGASAGLSTMTAGEGVGGGRVAGGGFVGEDERVTTKPTTPTIATRIPPAMSGRRFGPAGSAGAMSADVRRSVFFAGAACDAPASALMTSAAL